MLSVELTSLQLSAVYPLTSIGSFNIETIVSFDLYVLKRGSFTHIVSAVASMVLLEVTWLPVRIGMQ